MRPVILRLSHPNRLRRLLTTTLIAATTLQPVLQAASTLPTGGTFIAGAGNVTASGNVLTINQSTLRGIVDWNSFSIGKAGSVTFNNGAGATLNRVTGATPTSILGQLLASGNVYILNPEGILIGNGATVHTGGDFLATTLNLSNSAFLNGGSLLFAGASNATVVNLGDLASTGGSVYLLAHGVTNAGSITAPNGTAGLAAGSQILLADSGNGQHVLVEAPGGDVTNSGLLSAAQVELKSNGGNIYALAGNNSGQIRATGTATRDGHVWLIAENGNANVAGTISATNANGIGGAIETSGAHVNTNGARLTTGKGGNWLLDPNDLTINSSLAGTIETTLNGGTNVTEQTTASGTGGSGDITVASAIAWTSAADLTLSAYRNIALNAGISNTGSGNLTLRADNTSTGTGTISGSGVINFSGSTGNVALLYNPATFGTATDYSANFGSVNGSWTAPANGSVSSQYTAYMLVNSAANLQNLDVNDAGTYALGKDIDLSSIANFVPLGDTSPNFTGILDGMGHTISNLTITNPSTSYVGLFSNIAFGGQVRNLNLTNVDITPGSSYWTTGAIVGESTGTVVNSSSSGVIHTGRGGSVGGLIGYGGGTPVLNSSSSVTIDGSLCTSFCYVGGLVGEQETSITNSHATGSVTVAGTNAFAGGLVGYGGGVGTTSNSYATGAVSMSASSGQLGGLVGENYTPISNSYATGAVTGGSSAIAGGLVGYNSAAITNSYATGSVTGGDLATLGGLIGENYSTITSSYASGPVSGGADMGGGGLAGFSEGNISVSYALGSVTSGASSTIGGLVGYSAISSIVDTYARGAVTNGSTGIATGGLVGELDIGGTVSTSYSTGRVTAPGGLYTGGFIATVYDGSGVSNSYWDSQSSGMSTTGVGNVGLNGPASGVTPLTTAQLQSGTMPTGFNGANTVWTAPAGVYPYFGFQGPLVTIDGTAYNGSSAISSASVGALSNGALLGVVTTNASGFYTLSEPSNMIPTSGGVLTYLASNGTANTFSDGVNGYTGMDLYTGSLKLISAGATMSGLSAALATTLGGNTGANFLFTVPNGQLTLNGAANLSLSSSAASFSIDQPLTGPGDIFIETPGNLGIADGGALTAGSSHKITLVAGGAFSNNDGANALNVSDGGKWLVYSQNPANDNTGGITPVFKQYDAVYGVTAPAHSGDGLLYTLAPVITVGLTGTTSKTYNGNTAATLTAANFSDMGAIEGDTITLGAPSSGIYASSSVGTDIGVTASGISIASAINGSIPVYGYRLASSSASGSIGIITASGAPPPPPPAWPARASAADTPGTPGTAGTHRSHFRHQQHRRLAEPGPSNVQRRLHGPGHRGAEHPRHLG